MYRFKRILAIFLSVCLLSLTVGSTYFDTMHMEKVEAFELTAGAGLTAATLFQLCLFVGAVWGTYYLVGEVIDNQEEIARAGKNFIDSVTDIPDGWLLSMTDTTTGQDYVFGSEALELVQETSWEVIQGGGGHNRGDDDDDDNEKEGVINLFRSSSEYVGNFLALGATWFMSHASDLYHKWVNGEELTDAELEVVKPLINMYCNQDDISKQWNGEIFNYKMHIINSFNVSGSSYLYDYKTYKNESYPMSGYYYVNDNGYNIDYVYGTLIKSPKFGVIDYTMNNESSKCTRDGYTYDYTRSESYMHTFTCSNSYDSWFITYGANFPIFGSRLDAENYLKGTYDVTNALNYSKTFKNADWLSDDWQGLLIDPLTNIGLTLSQLIELMKSFGLNAVGNNLTPEELADLIRKSLPVVNPDLLPDESPVVVPDPPGEPVYYPSPDAHPLPDSELEPDPDPFPGTGDGDGTDGIDFDEIVPDASSEFSGIPDMLKKKFPFSLPWDLYALLLVLSDTPKTPVFKLPFVIERYDFHETIVIDMTDYEEISIVSRFFFSLLFAYALMNWTVKIVSVVEGD